MGRPFRIVQRLSEKVLNPEAKSSKKSSKKAKDVYSYIVVVENIEALPMFARYVVVKRTFFKIDEVLLAHREPEILNRVRDKGILHVFHSEVTRNDGRLGTTVAMEYCPGSLEQRLQQETRMLESEVVQVLLALASVLGYLHSRQPPVAHRNINPSNVLIHSESAGASAYRLYNFRSAMTEAYHCENHEEVVAAMEDFARYTTAGYRAPEMLDPSSHKRIDEQVDMWALGVLLYYTMYQRLPFTDACWGLARKPKLRYPVEAEVWYTGSLRIVLEHLLEPDPEKRWDAFALINFMRFDNDLCRHIGPFCFSQTERPEGWEPQDVKVIGRPVPAKVLPERLRNTGQSDDPAAAARDNRDEAAATSVKSRTAAQESGDNDQMVLKAVTALSSDTASTDPEVLAYREKLIREQEEAWQVAESAHKKRDKEDKDGATSGPADVDSLFGPTEKKEAVKENKASAIDDLFGGMETQPSQSQKPTTDDLFGGASTATASNQIPPQGSQVGANDSWKDDLFAAPPQQPQMQPQPAFPMAADSSWSTGAPTSVPMNPTGGMMGQQQAPMGWGNGVTAPGFQPMQTPQMQQQVPGGWGNGATASGFQPMQTPQMQQQVPGGWGNGATAPSFQPMQTPQMQQQVPGGWGNGATAPGFQPMQTPQMQQQVPGGAPGFMGGNDLFQRPQQQQPQQPEKDPFASLFK
ncbi:protein kinase, putative [Trypanosoma brucei brucei TREU927]|uniref:non-specific serine/threonine protein kinase n=1 Tax=Trypanosoma brucei brucei (strain 927/4 GUTat10.1) TaxID=185431 RepID=Q38ES8_TRYB2|nr:protein kinase, putative [Trypanosoma brucei brucei TREU927]EAN76692.1 protein kinase, putative [Trypanosoma brucei brucei TREU927]